MTAALVNRSVVLTSRPDGMPALTDFELVEERVGVGQIACIAGASRVIGVAEGPFEHGIERSPHARRTLLQGGPRGKMLLDLR
jgi:NADPH-dependent curcumin reductase CurA